MYSTGCTRWAIILSLYQPSSLETAPGHYPPVSPSSHSKGLNKLSLVSPPEFPMTPAEFHLFPSAGSTENTRNPQDTEIEMQDECLGVNHLTTLRSAAFWELRRSVIENGEGLIRRMRDYEQSRLHQQVCQKAKERKKRGRKSSTLRSRCKARPNVSEASEDEILICSEDTYNALSRRSPRATRARSLDPMDVDGEDQGHLGRRGSRSPGANSQLCYDEGMLFHWQIFKNRSGFGVILPRIRIADPQFILYFTTPPSVVIG
jgi:hypothetical protein